MTQKAEEARKRAQDTRLRRSRKRILDAALRLAEEGSLPMTMKALAAEAEVSVNTVKRQFDTVDAVAEALVSEVDSSGSTVSDDMLAALKASARRSTGSAAQTLINATERSILHVSSKGTQEALDELLQLHEKLLSEALPQPYLVAFSCAQLSQLILKVDRRNSAGNSQDSTETALRWANMGLEQIGDNDTHKYAQVGASLCFSGALAARRLCSIRSENLPLKPEPIERSEAEIYVVSNLAQLAKFKTKERDYRIKLRDYVSAAIAQFHSARAEALYLRSVDDEIQSALDAAVALLELNADGHIISPNIEHLMLRMLGVKVAYWSRMGEDQRVKLEGLCDQLIEVLRASDTHRTEYTSLTTLQTLADFYLGIKLAGVHGDYSRGSILGYIDAPNLIIVTSYGLLGKFLVAELLKDAAGGNIEIPESSVFDFGRESLKPAAKMYYSQAIDSSLIIGAALVISGYCRSALESPEMQGVNETVRWPLLQPNGEMVPALVTQLSLAAITGKRVTKGEASSVLHALRPLIVMLLSITNNDTGPEERLSFDMETNVGLW